MEDNRKNVLTLDETLTKHFTLDLRVPYPPEKAKILVAFSKMAIEAVNVRHNRYELIKVPEGMRCQYADTREYADSITAEEVLWNLKLDKWITNEKVP